MEENLRLIDRLFHRNVDLLIDYYIFNIPVKKVIEKGRSLAGVFRNKTYYISKRVDMTIPRASAAQRYTRAKLPYDSSAWTHVPRYNRDARDAVNLVNKLDETVYLTMQGATNTSIIKNSITITGNFAEVLAKTCLLKYLDRKNITLRAEDIICLLNQVENV